MNITKTTLQCPFNWHIDEVLMSKYDEKSELEVNVHTQPVISLMNSVMITYAKFEQGNYEGAENNLQKTDKIWNEIIKHKQNQIKFDKISLGVLLHIKEATEYFVLEKINSPNAKKMLDNISNSTEFKSKIEIATVEGCKSIIWLNFHEHAFQKAMVHAKLAYANSPDCSLWNFILAKTLRFSRRYGGFSNEITSKEKEYFLQSYKLLPIPYYAINVAEMYRDTGERDEAKKLLEVIFKENPSDVIILLPLVKSFISYKDFPKAKKCLEHIEKSKPHNSAFLHYKGMYFEKQGDYREAIKYLEKAIKNSKNYVAEMTYVRCMIKLYKRKFDYGGYLKKMVDKYNDSCYKQKVLLDLAMHYHFKKEDTYNAGLHLLQSIHLNPANKVFQNYYSYDKKEYINVFDFINKELIPKLQQCKKCNSNCDYILNDLKNIVNENEVSNRLLLKAVEEMKLNYINCN